MKNAELKILVASALLFVTASAPALQPEVLYGFQGEPENPHASLVQGSDGHFYGTTLEGGSSGEGRVFQLNTNGILTTLVSFNGSNGAHPLGGLLLGSDGHLYGTTRSGGSNYINSTDAGYGGHGTVFKVTTNGMLTTLVSFSGTNGAYPYAGLVLGHDGYFYGTTAEGGSTGYGTVFKVTTNGVLTRLVSFNGTNGAFPKAGLVLGDDGHFYGTTPAGGSTIGNPTIPYGFGTVFQVTTNGELTSLFSFGQTVFNGIHASTNANGAFPYAGLVVGRDGNFYGTASTGGGNGNGTVFKVTPSGVVTTLISFNFANGSDPVAGLALGYDGNFYGTTSQGGSGIGGTVFRVTPNGVLTTLVSFNGTDRQAGLILGNDGSFYGTVGFTVFKMTTNGVMTTLATLGSSYGANPHSGLVLGPDGHFYGTTAEGGSTGYGTVFQVTTNGLLTTLVAFNYANGAHPEAELVLGRDGSFYGTAAYGGSGRQGTIFRVTTNGVLTSLVSFSGANGSYPRSALVLGSDGNLYGTTAEGGSDCLLGCGTVFRVNTNGVLTTLVSFNNTNGAYPQSKLVLGRDGHFYGTTAQGGSSSVGTVFRVTSDGVLTSLVSFNGTNGAQPEAGLVLGDDGDLYGTTAHGTVFKVATNGVLITLVSFKPMNGLVFLKDGLMLGRDGHFYGTTVGFSPRGHDLPGTVFRVTTNGVLTILAVFAPDTSGANANELALGPDGFFYGTTPNGGPGGGGTIFRLVISAFTSVARQPDGSALLTGTGPINGGYRLWASPDLSLPFASWTLLTSASFDSNGNFFYTDAGAITNSPRFYQLSVP